MFAQTRPTRKKAADSNSFFAVFWKNFFFPDIFRVRSVIYMLSSLRLKVTVFKIKRKRVGDAVNRYSMFSVFIY